MKLTISRQLTLMALLTLAILLIVGVIGNRVAHSIGEAVEYSEKNTVPAVEAIALMQKTFLEIRVAVLGPARAVQTHEHEAGVQCLQRFGQIRGGEHAQILYIAAGLGIRVIRVPDGPAGHVSVFFSVCCICCSCLD